MKWYLFLIASAVNTITAILPLIAADEETKADIKLQMYNTYFAIQRAYPELAGPLPGVSK